MTKENLALEQYQTLERLTSSVRRDRRLSGPDVHSATVEDALSGSRLTMDAVFKGARIEDLGWRVRACSLGQAAAAIVLKHAKGLDEAQVARAATQLQERLAGQDSEIDWPELALFAFAKDIPSRHGAALLPFRALEQLFNRNREDIRNPVGTEAGSTQPQEQPWP